MLILTVPWQQKYFKTQKISSLLELSIPKQYKRNNINGDLHQTIKIASDFDAEISIITKKHLEAGYPLGLIETLISDFRKKDENPPIL